MNRIGQWLEQWFGSERKRRVDALYVLYLSTGMDRDPEVREQVQPAFESANAGTIVGEDLARIEGALIGGLPSEYVQPLLGKFREELVNLLEIDAPAAAAAAASGQTGRTASEATAGEATAARAELAVAATEVFRLRSLRGSLSLMRTCVCAIALAAAALYTVLGCWYLRLHDVENEQQRSITVAVILAGSLGGFISALGRLYRVKWRGSVLLRSLHVGSLGLGLLLNLLLAVLQGGVFALILYAFFASNPLEASVFPRLDFSGKDHSSDWQWFLAGAPQAAHDLAKALVWAFAAGFSERLVPDLIGEIASPEALRPRGK